jgi:cell wall-associated NlpC family hydrolase
MDNLVDIASRYVGIPYKHGGNSINGISCIFLVHNILHESGLESPAESFISVGEDWDKADPTIMNRELNKIGQEVIDDLMPLDVVMFALTDDAEIVSHVGVMIDKTRFIHVCDGVKSKVSKITHPFWRSKYRGARRVAVTDGKTRR